MAQYSIIVVINTLHQTQHALRSLLVVLHSLAESHIVQRKLDKVFKIFTQLLVGGDA